MTAISERQKEFEQWAINKHDNPSIYVACLASYNDGRLHGRWIDCTIGEDAVRDSINDMLKASRYPDAEEWAIHDHSGFNGYKVGEYDDIGELCEIAETLKDDQGNLIVEIFEYLGSGATSEDAKEFLENNYQGCHKDLGAYAYDLCEQSGDLDAIPQYISCHIDFDAMGRDMDYSGDIFTISSEGEIHVFTNR